VRIRSAILVALLAVSTGAAADVPWRISGDLSEACTCSVPCTCNFGEAPTPYSHCHFLWSLDIQKGERAGVKLGGLRLASASGAKGAVWYVDDRATPAQAAALEAIARMIQRRMVEEVARIDPKAAKNPQLQLLAFRTARITQNVGAREHSLKVGDFGEFESDYILGLDGKTPVVVENNWAWNIQRGIKAKTRRLRYRDEFGNEIDLEGTNANQGKFDWSDKTAVYFR
jgi:hypothetical protein